MFPKARWKMNHGLCMFPLPHNPSKGAVGTSPAVEKAQFREFGSQVFLLQPQPPNSPSPGFHWNHSMKQPLQ